MLTLSIKVANIRMEAITLNNNIREIKSTQKENAKNYAKAIVLLIKSQNLVKNKRK